MKRIHLKSGFTLPEVMMAVVVSLIVFAAMGMVLTRCFSLWLDAMAHWKMAQHARISRELILHGAFADPSGGLLSATNISIVSYSSALNVGYASEDNFYGVCVYSNITPSRMYLLDQKTIAPYWDAGWDDWSWGVKLGNSFPAPEVEVTHMEAALSGDLLTMIYRLQLSAAGKTFTQSQTIRAKLINYED